MSFISHTGIQINMIQASKLHAWVANIFIHLPARVNINGPLVVNVLPSFDDTNGYHSFACNCLDQDTHNDNYIFKFCTWYWQQKNFSYKSAFQSFFFTLSFHNPIPKIKSQSMK